LLNAWAKASIKEIEKASADHLPRDPDHEKTWRHHERIHIHRHPEVIDLQKMSIHDDERTSFITD